MAQEETATEQNGDSETRPSSGRPPSVDLVTTDSVTSEVIVSVGPENRPTVATEILRAEAGDVQAAMVTMDRAGAERVTAERVVMTNSGARTVEARSAQVDRSRSDKAVFSNSTAIAVATEEARFVRSRVMMLKADRATIEAGTRVAIYAGPAGENMRPLADVRGAAAFGAGLGAVLLVLGPLLRRVLRLR